MRHRPGAWWWPLRLTYGAFFAHTALEKRALDAKAAKRMHAFAVSAYPPLKRVEPTTLIRAMFLAESSIAVSLLVPFVPATVGGVGLSGYGAGLLGLYLRAPGLRREGSVRPSEFGLSVAKDSWMMAAGAAVLIDAVAARRHRPDPD